MTNFEKYFSRKEYFQNLIDTLDGYGGLYSEWKFKAFESDYYTLAPTQLLKNPDEVLEWYGIFGEEGALDKVIEYETKHYGKLFTDVCDKAELVDKLWAIHGMEVYDSLPDWFHDMMEKFKDDYAEDNINNQIIAMLKDICYGRIK